MSMGAAEAWPVEVQGDTCQVIVRQTGKATWTAIGRYKDAEVRVTGRSLRQALSESRRRAPERADRFP